MKPVVGKSFTAENGHRVDIVSELKGASYSFVGVVRNHCSYDYIMYFNTSGRMNGIVKDGGYQATANDYWALKSEWYEPAQAEMWAVKKVENAEVLNVYHAKHAAESYVEQMSRGVGKMIVVPVAVKEIVKK